MERKFKVGDTVEVVQSGSGFKKNSIGEKYIIVDDSRTYGSQNGYVVKNIRTNEIYDNSPINRVGEISFKLIKRAEMTKADLKDGMVVEYENGSTNIMLNGKLRGIYEWADLDYYNENLEHKLNSNFSIIRVWKSNGHTLHLMLSKGYIEEVLWECKPIIELTLKVNGKEINPCDLSKKSWANLRGK